MKVVTEDATVPLAQACLKCENLASLRCQQCGPFVLKCSTGLCLFHVGGKISCTICNAVCIHIAVTAASQ